MTGQVEFDSHASSVVAATVAAINVVTPGDAHGRPYVPPTANALVNGIVEALKPALRRTQRTPAHDDVHEFAKYLDGLRHVFVHLADGDLDGACVHCNEMLVVTNAIPELSRHDGQEWHLHFHAKDATWAVGWAGAMTTAIAMVLGSPMYERLGVCSAPVCDRVYVDTSRNGARRFCSTACQNRVKAAAFRERNRG